MEKISFRDIDIKNGFWGNRQEIVSSTSVYNVYKRFKETGRFDALSCNWKEGDPNKPHIFWDSDVAKWIESVAYITQKNTKKDLEKIVDDLTDAIDKARDENGYFNCYYLVAEQENRWTDRTQHELYCAGHLIEAAVAYYIATGKRKLLDIMKDFTNYIYKVFVVDKSSSFLTPGHEEIELALVKLYDLTKNEKYLELCKFFIDNRGIVPEKQYDFANANYSQSHLPVREQTTAEGHSVRAAYLYMAMADLSRLTNDKALFLACDKIFDNIANKRMYITGGIGSTHIGEAFTIDYDLPNLTAYAESCAAIALALFAQRMSLLEVDSKYGDIAEIAIYNNVLSSISLDGKSFFYDNPLEIQPILHQKDVCAKPNHRERFPAMKRVEVFGCSCCPPNITRFIASIADFLYSNNENTLFVHHYIDSSSNVNGISVTQKTNYPNDGKIQMTVSGVNEVAVRIPGWCESYNIKLNGKTITNAAVKGYVYIQLDAGENTILIDLDMKVQIIYPSQNIRDCIGKVAIKRGPMVYCAEGIDNDFSINSFALNVNTDFIETFSPVFSAYTLEAMGEIPVDNGELYSTKPPVFKKQQIKLIPYFGFANRGENGTEMVVYFLKT